MRTVKLDNRYNAHRKYGYKYCLMLCSTEWRKYFDIKKVAVNMFGESAEVGPRIMWRDDRALLGTAPWAYHYKNIRKTTHIYFREEQDLEQVVMLWALTANEIHN